MKRKQSKIAIATVVILFIVAGLMSFLGGSEVVSVFSRYNSNQDQTTPQDNQTSYHNQQNGTAENSGGNNQGTENNQNAEVQQQESANRQQETANSQETQQSHYRIDVDVTEQIVRIYYRDSEIKQFTASTGVNNLTPLGDFEIQNRGEWFFSEKYQQGAKYWVSFKDWGVYLFHSVPMDEQKKMIAEEAAKLGTPASHGCIRLEVENAKWIYDNIPQGTKVHIH